MEIIDLKKRMEEKNETQKILDALKSIGLTEESLPDLTKKSKEIILKECQEMVREKFYKENILTPKFGEGKTNEDRIKN